MSNPNETLQALLQPGSLRASLFSATSRYSGIETAMLERDDGRMLIFIRRRFIPLPESFALLREHIVSQGDRMDAIAAKYLGDPEQFWRICDANAATRPDELTETVGRRLRITLPEGIPGIQNA